MFTTTLNARANTAVDCDEKANPGQATKGSSGLTLLCLRTTVKTETGGRLSSLGTELELQEEGAAIEDLVELVGIEPTTSSLATISHGCGGAGRDAEAQRLSVSADEDDTPRNCRTSRLA